MYELKLSKEEVPAAPDMDKIDIDAEYIDYESAFVNMVTVDVDEYAKKHFEKSVKKTLTIPSWLNELAVANGINFSQVLQTALKDKLNVNLDEQLKDPKLKAEYDALEPEFTIIQTLIDARKKSGITQSELSKLTGIAQGDISNIETGNANPSIKTLQRLAAALGKKLKIEFV